MAKGDYTPFDFMNAASFTKADLIKDSENPDITEKQYILLRSNVLTRRKNVF